MPPGVVNYLPGVGEEIGPTLVEHPDVAMIAFTGSRSVGLLINRAGRRNAGRARNTSSASSPRWAARTRSSSMTTPTWTRRSTASSPAPSATRARSARRAAGSSCRTALYDAFLARLVEATRSLKVAPAEDPGCARRPGHRRRGPAAHPATPSRRARARAGSSTPATSGPLARRRLLRRPAHLRRRAADGVAWPRKRSSARSWRC